ncbi:hypothetical protein FRB99_006288 [Tulasnella sp. 403]|nr:hypothetical protein FRB99_006288 [Tulasnella sp. 403]
MLFRLRPPLRLVRSYSATAPKPTLRATRPHPPFSRPQVPKSGPTQPSPWWEQSKAKGEHLNVPNPPKSEKELVLLLLQLSEAYPRPSIKDLLIIHEQHQDLHSVHSFNFLFDFACRHNEDSWDALLVQQMMEDRGFSNAYGSQLLVRHLVNQGRRKTAMRIIKSTKNKPILRKLLLEVIGPPSLRTHRTKTSGTPTDLPLLTSPSELLRALHPEGDETLSPAFIQKSVQHLLYLRRYAEARDVVASSIRVLPSDAPPRQLGFARSLIHLLLHLPSDKIPKYPDKDAVPMVKTMELFDLHPKLMPSETTLLYAIEWLRRRRNRGFIAYASLRRWKAKWGDAIETSAIRRRIARYAIQENNLHVFQKIVRREYAFRRTEESVQPAGATSAVGERNTRLWRKLLASYHRVMKTDGTKIRGIPPLETYLKVAFKDEDGKPCP